MPRVTIAEVARRAGVSPTAVSFTFNNPSELSPGTVERVLEAAEDLGYAPNPHARALLSSRAGVLGVLVPDSISDAFANPFYAAFVQGVGAACEQRGLSLMVISPLEGSPEEAITRAPADGFIVVGLGEDHPDISPLSRRRVPFVIVDGEARESPSVNVEDERGAYEAASYVLSRGHEEVLVMSILNPREYLEEPYYEVDGRRRRGYQRAYTEHGLPWREELVRPSPSSAEGGDQCFETVWEAGRRPTAVLCMSDAAAFGVLRAARRRGLRVPEDLEVVGFNDVPLAALTQPALSTVRQPTIEKGRISAQLLTEALEDGEKPGSVTLPTELVLRETTLGEE